MQDEAMLETEVLSQKLHTQLQQKFQLQDFRVGQLEAMLSLLQKKRLLCIQPTGHGKSLLYQLPATLLSGMTIVVSPLLALMRDQIHHLTTRFNITAASINSDQSEEDNAMAQNEAMQGRVKILFVAPEKLDNLRYFQFLGTLPISLIVIDEAHCISTWGHDFRPSYRQIMQFISAVEKNNVELKVLAITATANAKTEDDIRLQLASLHRKEVIVQRQSMKRDNIQLSVISVMDMAEKLSVLQQIFAKIEGNGIVYCATRDNTELVAGFLQTQGFNVMAYHAGYEPDKKRYLQQQFIQNQYKAIAATNSLGMGIDKQDLRFIIHFDVPGSITAYYQEVGRCGRDGKLAQGILLFNERDLKIQQYFIDSAQPNAKDFKLALELIRKNDGLQLTQIKRDTGLHPTIVTVMLAELTEQGLIVKKLAAAKQVYKATDKTTPLDLSRYEIQWALRTQELNSMVRYSLEKKHCFMHFLSKALDDSSNYQCGHCDNCLRKASWVIKPALTKEAKSWLLTRNVSIHLSQVMSAEEGVSLLDAQMRSPIFIEFMQNRANAEAAINPVLLDLIQSSVQKLQQQYRFSAIICLPSHTWSARSQAAEFIAKLLQIPLFLDALSWKIKPEQRQGELLNNDQRRYNVDKKMQFQAAKSFAAGSILLLDDYIGSGATLKEAVRVLQPSIQAGTKIVPFTIASVRWRLGKRGMI